MSSSTSKGGSWQYKAPDHASTMLTALQDIWRRRLFCDVEILIGEHVYNAHKNVLSACSSYFRAMFSGGLAQSEQKKIEIHAVQPEIFQLLLEFIYTSSIRVSVDNCQDLLAAADMFGLEEVVVACCTFLKQELHPSNAIGIYLFAETHCCDDLQVNSETYIHNHFLNVIQEEEYFDLLPEVLIRLLASENLHIDNEFQIFMAAMKWILHDPPKRRKFVFDVLDTVRFPIISQKQLDKYVSDLDDLSLKIALRKLLQDFHSVHRLPYEVRVSKTKPCHLQPRRCARKSLYVIGGYSRDHGGRWSDSKSLNIVERFDTFFQQWRPIAPLKHARSGHGVSVLNGLIYVIGGESDSLIYDTAECLDPATNKWSMIPSMTTPRCGLSVCVVDDAIYAIGGWVGSEIGNTVERYDPHLNHWSQVDKVSTLRFAMGIAEQQGLIYMLGGMSELGTELRVAETYNPITKDWTRLPDMNRKRAYVGVAVIENYVYAVGGWNEYQGAMSSVERYSIEKGKWEDVLSMSTPRAGASVAAINGLLYVIGGRTTNDEYTAPATLDSVECYDPHTDSWMELGAMPTSRCEAGVVVH